MRQKGAYPNRRSFIGKVAGTGALVVANGAIRNAEAHPGVSDDVKSSGTETRISRERERGRSGKSRILVVVPHADELAFHVGGTIARRAAEGDKIFQVVTTDGATASFTRQTGEMKEMIRKEAHRAGEQLGLQDVFVWDYGDGTLDEGKVMELHDRLTALVRYLQVDTIFGFDPWSPRDYHPDMLITGKATFWTAYFSGFPLHLSYQRDLGLKPSMILDQYYFAYYPEGDRLEAVDITSKIEKKIEAVMVFKSQVQWCADIEIAQRQRAGRSTEGIDRDNYGPTLAAQIRAEAKERGKAVGFEYAEVMRHLSEGEGPLT